MLRLGIVLLLAAVPLLRTGATVTTLTPQARNVRELAAALSAPDPAARAAAACALRQEGDAAADAIPQLVALLADPSPVEHSVCAQRWWRGNPEDATTPGELAASALVSIGTRAFQPLADALSSSAWVARRNAARALGALDDRRAVRPLQAALTDREAAVREQAAWALGAIGDTTAVPALVESLRDADEHTRRQAAWALGAIDDARAVDALIRALSDPGKGVREQAAWALGAIGDSRAVAGLLPVLKDPAPTVRRQAAWALGVLAR